MTAVHSDLSRQAGRWAVVNTHPHKEHIAVQNLTQQAFETIARMCAEQSNTPGERGRPQAAPPKLFVRPRE